MRSSTTTLNLRMQRIHSANLPLMCASAGAMLTGACLLSLAAQADVGVMWQQSPLLSACLLCAALFAIMGILGGRSMQKHRYCYPHLQHFALILGIVSLLVQAATVLWV